MAIWGGDSRKVELSPSKSATRQSLYPKLCNDVKTSVGARFLYRPSSPTSKSCHKYQLEEQQSKVNPMWAFQNLKGNKMFQIESDGRRHSSILFSFFISTDWLCSLLFVSTHECSEQKSTRPRRISLPMRSAWHSRRWHLWTRFAHCPLCISSPQRRLIGTRSRNSN